jgi:hypothetical protein
MVWYFWSFAQAVDIALWLESFFSGLALEKGFFSIEDDGEKIVDY